MSDPKDGYNLKKEREVDYYFPEKNPKTGFFQKILNSPLIFSKERVDYSYIFPKQQMSQVIERRLGGVKRARLLNSPCGTGIDFKYINKYANQIIGIDLASVALADAPETIDTAVGDILEMPFQSSSFDIVVCPLFFHHFVDFGFAPFLTEYERVLKPGGLLVILEPSVWYPLNLITRPAKHLFNNPFGEVEDERPFRPKLMLDSLSRVGFKNIEYQAASYNHPVFFIILSRLVNKITAPFHRLWPVKNWAWMIVYSCQKAG